MGPSGGGGLAKTARPQSHKVLSTVKIALSPSFLLFPSINRHIWCPNCFTAELIKIAFFFLDNLDSFYSRRIGVPAAVPVYRVPNAALQRVYSIPALLPSHLNLAGTDVHL